MLWELLYKIGYIFAIILPLKVGYCIAQFFADLQYKFLEKDRTAVTNNLRVILNNNQLQTIEQYANDVFRNFSKYLVDFFRFVTVDKDYIDKKVKIEGLQNLENALSKKRGALALSAHIGNWELGATVISILGYHINVIALEHSVKWVNDFFIRQRANKGIKVFPPKLALKRCLVALRNNEIIGLLGDREFYNQGIVVNFLGKPSFIPKGPALISLKTAAPIVPTFMIRQRDDSFKLIFEPPIELAPSGNKEEDVKGLINKYLTVIEKYIKECPSQWCIFQKFWEKVQNKEIV